MNPLENAAGSVSETRVGRPWWKVCCIGCLLMLLAPVIAIVILSHVFSGVTEQSLSTLPPDFPSDIQLYRLQNASSISYLPGKSKGKLAELLSYPSRWFGSSSSSAEVEQGAKQLIDVAESTDRVTVTWSNLNVKEEDVMLYYAALFKQLNMQDRATIDDATHSVIDVANRKDVSIQIGIRDLPEVPGVDQIVVTVDYIPKK